MVLNKRSQVILYTLMLSSALLVLSLAFAGPIKYFITSSNNEMNCSTTTEDGVKASCYGYEILMFVGIGTMIGVALYVMGAKFIK